MRVHPKKKLNAQQRKIKLFLSFITKMMLNTRGRMNSDFGFHYIMKMYQDFR